MDIDATQVIDDFGVDVTEESRKDGSPVSFLKLLKQKNFEERLIPIFEGVNKVGRDVACHVILESKTLSKEHCCIEVICDNHFIYDLGSSNKSRRNKMILMPNVRYELNNNDALTLADLKLVYIKSPALHVGNSGSDTESLPESESMLQVYHDGVDVAFESQTADHDDEDDDDTSSDILQPTQHAGTHLIGLHNKINAFVEDSFQHVTSENKGKESFADETVLETPPPPPRVLFGAEMGADFVPESNSDTEEDTKHCFKPSILEFNSTDTEMEVKSKAVASYEPTQTYSMDFVNETIAVEPMSGSESKSTSVPEESPALLCNADVAPTQVFDDASVENFHVDDAPAEVFSGFHVSSSKPLPQSKMDSSWWKTTNQESIIACGTDVEETQVVEETSFPITLGDCKATEKFDVNQATQMYVEETQMYEDEAATVVEIPSLINKEQSEINGKMMTVRESSSSVIAFSPQSASTQVFSSDAETSFLPTLLLETSDRLDTADDDDKLAPTLSPTTAISLSSENRVICTGLDSEKSQTSTDDVCTQVFSHEAVGQIPVEPTEDNLCTQIYEEDLHFDGSGEAMAKSSQSTDDICTQVYQDRDVHLSGSGVACMDDICSEDYSTNRPPDIITEGMERVSSNPNPHAPNSSTSNPLKETTTTVTSHANKIAVATDTVAVKEIAKQGASTEPDFLHFLPYQTELITVEPRGISNVVSESTVRVADEKTVENRDSDDTDELTTGICDNPGVEQRSKGKRCKKAAEPSAEYLHEGKNVSAKDSVELPGSYSATKKSTDQKQGRRSKLSSRRSILIQSEAETINLAEEAKGLSSKYSDQCCNDSAEKKRNETSKRDTLVYGNATKQSDEKQIVTDNIMNSEGVSDNSRKLDAISSEKEEVDSSSKALGRRASMRQNKGKRPEDNEFVKPSEEKRKNKRGMKRLAEELQPLSGVESPNKKMCSDPEGTPLISLSEGLDSQSSKGTRSSEVVDSSQLSDDDLPSLASLVALNRGQGPTTRNTLSKDQEHRFPMLAEIESVQAVGGLESEETRKGGRKDAAEDKIMKKESGNKNKSHRGSKRNQGTEAKTLSEGDSPVEGNNDQTTLEPTRKESNNKKKKMSFSSRKSQASEVENDVLLEEKKKYLKEREMRESDSKKKKMNQKNQRNVETTNMLHSEEDYVAEKRKAGGSRSCESTSDRDQSEGGAEDVKEAGQKRVRSLAGGQKQMKFSEDSGTEGSEKSCGRQRRMNAKKPVTEKSVLKEPDGSLFSSVVEVPVSGSEEPTSSKNTNFSSDVASLPKGDSKLSNDLETESGPSILNDNLSKTRRRIRTAVIANDNEVAGSIQRKSCKSLTADIDTTDENLMDNDAAIESVTSGLKNHRTMATDLNVVKETTEEVPKRLGSRKKSLRTLVAESDDRLSKVLNEDLVISELPQPLRELETDSAELAIVGETKRTARARTRITESELSTLSLKKNVKNAAAVDSDGTEEKAMGNSEIKLMPSAMKSLRVGASDDLDDEAIMKSCKELDRRRVDETKSSGVCAGEVIDGLDAEKVIYIKKSMTRKSCRGLFTENGDRVMKMLSDGEDKISGKILEAEDAGEKYSRPESKLSTKKTNRRNLAAEKNADVVERSVATTAAKPIRAETGSRRGKKTEPRVEEENEICDAAQKDSSGRKNIPNLTTSNENPQVHVLPVSVVEEASEQQRPEGIGQKKKNYKTALNENDEKDSAKVKIDVGVDSKRLRVSGKTVKADSMRSNETVSHLKADEEISMPDLLKGTRRRTKSGLAPVIRPKVMFTGVVDENGQKTVKSLGGEMVESIFDCTHLVTDQVRRTVKFLCGVARGLSVVSPKWLEDSRSAGRFLENANQKQDWLWLSGISILLDPSEFLVSDVENEKKFNFSLEQTLKEAAKRPLLMGLSIHVTENVRPDPTQMKDIINCAGGKFVQELPRSFEDDLIIVTCDGKDLESCRRLEELGIPLVSSEYIMTGILQHRLDANIFRLTTKKTLETSRRNKPETLPVSRKKQKR